MFEQHAQWYFNELILLICRKLKIKTEHTDGTETPLEEIKKLYPDIYKAYNQFVSEYLNWAKKVDGSQEINIEEIIRRDDLLKELVQSVNAAEK